MNKNTRKIAKIFAVAGIAFSGVVTADAVALAKALESGQSEPVHQFIATHSHSSYVGDAILYLAKGPKTSGDHGRPDSFGDPGRPSIFGPPGQPAIGAPGQYFG